jgi:phosphate/sulfate permease
VATFFNVFLKGEMKSVNNIKKAGIITGAVVGGTIGGTISLVGKMTNQKFIDELGESVVDSTILTGGIAGDIASGATNVISGKIKKSRRKVKEGKKELKSAGNQIVGNFVNNVQTVVDNSGEILEGVKEKDRRKVLRGAKTLAKVVAVGAITVGAVKVKPEEPEEPAKETDEKISREE